MGIKIAAMFVACLLLSGQAVRAGNPSLPVKEDDPMSIVFQVQESRFQNPNDRMAERVARSKAFDRWEQQFSHGDLKGATKSWGDVLVALRAAGATDCSRLICIANERTVMSETSANRGLLKHLLAATEQSMGLHHRFTATCCRYIAMQLEGSRDFANALKFRKRQRDILLDLLGSSHIDTVDAQKSFAKDSAICAAQQQKAR